MGVCNGKRQIEVPKPKRDYESVWGLTNEQLLVQHFNSPVTAQSMISNNQTTYENIQEMLSRIVDKSILNLEIIADEIKKENQNNSARILRCISQQSDSALRVTQKYFEFIQYYFGKYLEVNKDIQLVKNIILRESIQIGLEHLMIVNTLLKKDYQETDVWFTSKYYDARVMTINSTFPEVFSAESVENLNKLKENTDSSITNGFSDIVDKLKIRMSVSISMVESEEFSKFTSFRASVQIKDAQLEQFYQQMAQVLKVSQLQHSQAYEELVQKKTAVET